MIGHGIPEDAVDLAVRHPLVAIASDGGAFITGGEHPRGAGTFARVLGHYVREMSLLTLMDALRKMTLMPAQRLESFAPQMQLKGRIREGADADITIFDPKLISDHATFEDPHRFATGVQHVLVNGIPVVSDGRHTGKLPGRAVRGPGWTQAQ